MSMQARGERGEKDKVQAQGRMPAAGVRNAATLRTDPKTFTTEFK
jgi:hypothetical protein